MSDFDEESRSPAHNWPGHDRDGYTPPVEVDLPQDEMNVIVLPCGHLHMRPEGISQTITCHCGIVWALKMEHGGRSWGATRVAHSG